ncbi:septation ring formation regulator EzrA [Bacillaceae bacterium S4-13-56]
MEYIIALIIIILALIITGLIIRKKIYDEVDRLEAWKIDIMSRQVTEELGKVKALNLYGETQERFEQWREQWDDILTKRLPNLEEDLFDTEEAADRYRFRTAKKIIKDIQKKLNQIEKTIDQMFQELDHLIHAEKDSKKAIETLYPQLKDLRKNLLKYRHLYGKAEIKIELALDELDERVDYYHILIESGNYSDAQEIVLLMKEEIENIKYKMEHLPTLYKKCRQELPSQLDEVIAGLKEMREDGYRVDSFGFEKTIQQDQAQLLIILEQLEKGEIIGVQDELQEIEEHIQDIYNQLEQEVHSRNYLQKNIPSYEKELNELDEDFKQTDKEIEILQASYHLESKDVDYFLSLNKQLKLLQKHYEEIQKRMENSKDSHSIIKGALDEWRFSYEELYAKHEEFFIQMKDIRKDEKEANEKIVQLKKNILQVQRNLQKSNLPGVPVYIVEAVKEAHRKISEAKDQLERIPIDIKVMHGTIDQAAKSVHTAVEQTDLLIEQATLAEQSIQYGNRYRSQYSMMAVKLADAEHAFRSYDYEAAVENVAEGLEKIEPGAMKRIEERLSSEMKV